MNVEELIQSQRELNQEIEQETASEEDVAQTDVNLIQLVSFLLDDVEYGIDILSVHEILRIPDLTRLPNTPMFIKGVINLRGNVIPVVDVRSRFGLPRSKKTDLTRIIVIETDNKLIGLMVDNVHQVVRIPEVNVDVTSDLIAGISEEFIIGVGRLKDRLIVLLNMTNIILSDEELKNNDNMLNNIGD